MPYAAPKAPGLDVLDSQAEAANINAAQGATYTPVRAAPAPPPPPPPPPPPVDFGSSAPVVTGSGHTYAPAVERWRQPVSQVFPPELVDKALWVINHESGGNHLAQGDSGAAFGLFQSHYTKSQDPTAQIADAYRLLQQAGGKWTDWGEGATYQGRPFGALGNFPYPANASANASDNYPRATAAPVTKGPRINAYARAGAQAATPNRLTAADVESDPGKASVLQSYLDAIQNDRDANNLLQEYAKEIRDGAPPWKAFNQFRGSFESIGGGVKAVGPLAVKGGPLTVALTAAGGIQQMVGEGLATLNEEKQRQTDALLARSGAPKPLQDVIRRVAEGPVPRDTQRRILEMLPFFAGGEGTAAQKLAATFASVAGGYASEAAGAGRSVGEIAGPLTPGVVRMLAGRAGLALTEEEAARIAKAAQEAELAKPIPGQTGMFGEQVNAQGVVVPTRPPTGIGPEEFRGEQGGMQARAFTVDQAPPKLGTQIGLEDTITPAAQAATPIATNRVTVKAGDLEYRPDLFQARDTTPGQPFDERRVQQIVDNWDPAQFTTPTAVPDPENPGKYIVTMGQHRTEAFKRVYGPDAPVEVNVSPHDIRDRAQLARAQLEADQSNATTKALNVREEIRNLQRASAMGETPEQIAGRLGKSASYVDKLNDIARLGPLAADAVVAEPALLDYAAEAGRGMRAYGINTEDANGLFERIKAAAKGSRPTVTALRETIDKFGRALSEASQNPLFDVGKLEGTQGGLLGMITEYASVQGKLRAAINAARRAQKSVQDLAASATADASHRTAAEQLASLGKAEEARLRADLKGSEDDVLRALKGDFTPRPAPKANAGARSANRGAGSVNAGPPALPPGPPAERPPPGAPDPDLEDLLSTVESAGAVRPDMIERRSAELSRRVAVAEQMRQQFISEGMNPTEAQQRSRGALRGRLADPFFQTDVNLNISNLGKRIDASGLQYFTRNAAHEGMDKLSLGIIPAPHEVQALGQVFGPRFQYALEELGNVFRVQSRVTSYIGREMPALSGPGLAEEGAITAERLAEAIRPGAGGASEPQLLRVAQRLLESGDVKVVPRRDGKAGILLDPRGKDALLEGVYREMAAGEYAPGKQYNEPTPPTGESAAHQTLPPETPTLAGERQVSASNAEPVPPGPSASIGPETLEAYRRRTGEQAPLNEARPTQGAPLSPRVLEEQKGQNFENATAKNPPPGLRGPRLATPSQELPPAEVGLTGEGQGALSGAEPAKPGPSAPTPARAPNEPQIASEGLTKAGRPVPKVPGGDWKPGQDLISVLGRAIGEITSFPKSALSLLDRSAVLRQGAPLMRRTKQVWDAFKVTQFIAEDAADAERLRVALHLPEGTQIANAEDVMAGVTGSRWADVRKQAGLIVEDFTSKDASLRNEQFMSSWAEKVPWIGGAIRMSDRAFVVYLNKLRADVFDSTVEGWIRNGYSTAADAARKISPSDFVDLADYLNKATGRGNLGDFEKAANVLAKGFWSPRNVVARFQVIEKLFDPRTSGLVRKEMAKDLAVFFGTGITLLGLAKFSGLADVELDPRSADFGKMRVGPTRIDFFAGYSQIARVMAQLYTGQAKASTGTIYSIDSKKVVGNYLLNKLSPASSETLQLAGLVDDQNKSDRVFTGGAANFIYSNAVPLFIQDIVDAVRHQGIAGLAVAPLTYFGAGVQSYVTPAEARDQQRNKAAGDLFPGQKYRDLLPTQQAKVDVVPAVADKITAAQQSSSGTPYGQYRQARDRVMGPIDAKQAQAEGAFQRGELSQPLPDTWHDLGQERLGASEGLREAFKQTLSGFQQGEFDKALDGYYAITGNDSNPDGTPNWDKVEADRTTYLAKQTQDAQTWLNDYLGLTEEKKSPLRQQYDADIQHRVAVGYYRDGITAQEKAALQEAHPEVDVSLWKWYGGVKDAAHQPALNSNAAVDQALAMNMANRPVRLAGFGRPINETPESRQAWDYSKKAIDAFENQLVPKFGDQEAQRLYRKPYGQLTKDQQQSVETNLRTQARQDTPELDAFLMWWGATETLQSQAAVKALSAILTKYGKTPPKAGFAPKLAQNAP